MDYYIPKTELELSQRKLEEYERYCSIIAEGRRNPVWFGEWAFGIKLFDYQAYELMSAWVAQFVAWLNCRGAGKTTLLDIYAMLRLTLIPSYKMWVSCNSVSQGNQLFTSLEDIALRKNPAFKTLTDIFQDEVEKNSGHQTGFIKAPDGYKFELYNHSTLAVLSTNLMAIRGKRGTIIVDEAMGLSSDRAAVIEYFGTTNSDFGMGVGEQMYIDPKAFQQQMIYASSAGDVGTIWWDKYVTFSKRMLIGDTNYFACDINANTVVNFSTISGIKAKTHLNENAIAKGVEEDSEKADRELFNLFRKGGGKDAVVQADTLLRNSHVYAPVYLNESGNRKFILCYDPARAFDNSVLGIFELIEDPEKGLKLRLVNMISMVDLETKKKTPLNMVEQLKIIKKCIVDYNGDSVPEYENIELYVDAGAGGGGLTAIGDGLMEDWTSEDGAKHRGLIDITHPKYETSRKKYPNASTAIHLLEPTKHKVLIFDAFQKMSKMDLIEYPDYDDKGYLLLEGDDKKTYEYKLTNQEILSLVQCNLAKNEILYVVRTETGNGSVHFDLMPDKRNIMHDDRALVA